MTLLIITGKVLVLTELYEYCVVRVDKTLSEIYGVVGHSAVLKIKQARASEWNDQAIMIFLLIKILDLSRKHFNRLHISDYSLVMGWQCISHVACICNQDQNGIK